MTPQHYLSWSGEILVGLAGLASLPLLGLGVLGGLEWTVLVGQVAQVGLEDLVSPDPEQRGPQRWSYCCPRMIRQQVLVPLVGLAVLGDQLGQQGLEHLEVPEVPWLQEVLEVLGQ